MVNWVSCQSAQIEILPTRHIPQLSDSGDDSGTELLQIEDHQKRDSVRGEMRLEIFGDCPLTNIMVLPVEI